MSAKCDNESPNWYFVLDGRVPSRVCVATLRMVTDSPVLPLLSGEPR